MKLISIHHTRIISVKKLRVTDFLSLHYIYQFIEQFKNFQKQQNNLLNISKLRIYPTISMYLT